MPGWCKPGSSGHMTYAPGKFCKPGVEKVACGWGVQYSADTYISYRGSLFPASTSGVSLFHPSCILCGGLPIYSGPDVAHLPLDFNDAGPVSTVIMTFCLVGEDLRNLPAISNLFSCLSLLANSSGNGGVLSQGVLSWVTLLLPTLNINFTLPSGMKQQPFSICSRLFKAVHGSYFSCQWLVHFGNCFFKEWQRSVVNLCIF